MAKATQKRVIPALELTLRELTTRARLYTRTVQGFAEAKRTLPLKAASTEADEREQKNR